MSMSKPSVSHSFSLPPSIAFEFLGQFQQNSTDKQMPQILLSCKLTENEITEKIRTPVYVFTEGLQWA